MCITIGGDEPFWNCDRESNGGIQSPPPTRPSNISRSRNSTCAIYDLKASHHAQSHSSSLWKGSPNCQKNDRCLWRSYPTHIQVQATQLNACPYKPGPAHAVALPSAMAAPPLQHKLNMPAASQLAAPLRAHPRQAAQAQTQTRTRICSFSSKYTIPISLRHHRTLLLRTPFSAIFSPNVATLKALNFQNSKKRASLIGKNIFLTQGPCVSSSPTLPERATETSPN